MVFAMDWSTGRFASRGTRPGAPPLLDADGLAHESDEKKKASSNWKRIGMISFLLRPGSGSVPGYERPDLGHGCIEREHQVTAIIE
jgi:hypothetical protein